MPAPTPTTQPQLTREQRANLRFIECSAVIEPASDGLRPDEEVALAAVQEAAGPPMVTNGVPTIARVVAWMAHAGPPNRNRQAFVKEELEAAAQKIGLPNYPLVMDFNHAAIRRPEGAQRMVGFWYKADFAFDPKANGGEGAWGILVQGILFSWLFPEIADLLLAEQARNQKVDFSMACIAGSVEFGRDAKGSFEILHNPTFFTNAVLDVPPADADATGMLEEGSTDPALEQKLMDKLVSAEAFKTLVRDMALAAVQTGGREEVMPNETKPTIAYSHVLADDNVTLTMTSTYTWDTEAGSETYVVTLPEHPAVAEVAALTAKIADLEAALEAAKAAAEEQTAKLTELATANEQLTARVAEIDAAAAEQAAKEKLAARLAELPEAYRQKHLAKADAERADIEMRFAQKSDEDWQEFVALLADAVPAAPSQVNTASYRARTLLEGNLVIPPTTENKHSISERVQQFKR